MTKTSTLLLALLFTGCASSSALDRSRDYSSHGDAFRAFEILDAEREARQKAGETTDEEFEREYSSARQRFLVDRARRLIFLEQEVEAIVDLAKVLQVDPDNREALVLRLRALDKLAAKATAIGDNLRLKNNLEEALASYIEAERNVPGYKEAVDGAELVRQAVARLNERAQQQFLEAVRKMPEFRYVEVRWHSANALTNDPKRDDAEALRARANHEIALRTVQRGKECQKKDQFGAALVEFRTAQKLEPTLPGIDDAIAQMEREVQATWLSERASMDMRMGRFEAANAGLKKAFDLSTLSRGRISELMIESRRLEADRDYKNARDFEIQGKKREALAAFEALTTRWPDGFSDEKARIDGLRSDIDLAEQEWAAGEAAETAGDLPKALEHFLASERYYADFKDAKGRITSLRAKIAGSGTPGTKSGG
jgi:tetratricopeptide (TPR) repeat protein